jgi:hypothetical protein
MISVGQVRLRTDTTQEFTPLFNAQTSTIHHNTTWHTLEQSLLRASETRFQREEGRYTTEIGHSKHTHIHTQPKAHTHTHKRVTIFLTVTLPIIHKSGKPEKSLGNKISQVGIYYFRGKNTTKKEAVTSGSCQTLLVLECYLFTIAGFPSVI